MRAHDELDIVETKFFSNVQKKYLPQATPDLHELTASEIKHIEAEAGFASYLPRSCVVMM